MIFCVEDDAGIRDLMAYALQAAGMAARGLADGAELFDALRVERPSLILLDIMLPGEDGLAILGRLRADAETAEIPVILASAKGTEYDKVIGLDLGADDYLAKPFGMMEMVSRVRAVLRRAGRGWAGEGDNRQGAGEGSGQESDENGSAQKDIRQDIRGKDDDGRPVRQGVRGKGDGGQDSARQDAQGMGDGGKNAARQVLRIGELSLCPAEHTVHARGERVMLTKKEYDLLRTFMENPGIVFTRDQLLESVWGEDYVGETRTVDVHIGNLRTKLGECGKYIETLRGIGYRMEARA